MSRSSTRPEKACCEDGERGREFVARGVETRHICWKTSRRRSAEPSLADRSRTSTAGLREAPIDQSEEKRMRRTHNELELLSDAVRIAGACSDSRLPRLAPNTSSAAALRPYRLPEVEVAPVEQRDVPIYREWIGTLDGMVNAAIKAAGHRLPAHAELHRGSFVQEGTVAVRDRSAAVPGGARPGAGPTAQANGAVAQAQAQLVQSRGQVAEAEANQHRTQLDEDRYIPLAQQQAITQQDLDNATQNNLVREGAGAGRQGAGGNRARRRFRPRGRGRGRKAAVETAQGQSGIHTPASRRSTASPG